MRQWQQRLDIGTRGKGLTEITQPVLAFVRGTGVADGLLTLWCRHTSASLLVQENASPEVRADLEDFLARLVPEGSGYRHADEGPDDMPAHIRAALTQVQLSIPVAGGRPVLGRWQGIFVWEHRAHAHKREIALHLLGMTTADR